MVNTKTTDADDVCANRIERIVDDVESDFDVYPAERTRTESLVRNNCKVYSDDGVVKHNVKTAIERMDDELLVETDSVDTETTNETVRETGHTAPVELFESGQVLSPGNDYELAENVLVDIVDYIRSSTIRNEQQFVLLTLSYASGMMADSGDYISSVTIGTSSSGKTHVKDQADRLFTHLDVMDASSGSDKSLIYDDDWDSADIISMGELNQPSDEMIEFMKRAHGGDDEVVIRSTRGNPSSGFDTEVIRKDAKAYHFTFAQFEADFEFWNRLLKIPVHESESKNRAVGRMAFDHGDIGLDDDAEYGYDFEAGTERLQAHMLEVKRHAPKRVVIPNGELGPIDTWSVLEPIFNHERSESNRVYKMVSNLIKSSALLNYQSRETIEVSVTGEDGEPRTAEAIVAEPQDVANVCRCLETLRATTHEIDARKRSVIEAIRTKGGEDNTVESLEPVVEYLEESDASQVNKPELEAIIDDLEADYLVTTDGSSITARNWDALGEPAIGEHAEAFSECVDPISGEEFLPAWQQHRADVRTDGADLLGDVEIDSEPTDPTATQRVDTDIEPAGGDLDPHQRSIYATLSNTINGLVVDDPAECSIEAFLGLVEPGEAVTTVETTGTLLDPDHDVWEQPDKPDSWVTTETDARRELQTAIRAFVDEGLFTFESNDSGVVITTE